MTELLKFKREHFRYNINKREREHQFNKKRIVKHPIYITPNEDDQDLYQLQNKNLNSHQIYQEIQNLYDEHNLFPERSILIIAKLKLLTIKLVMIDQKEMNTLFEIIQQTFLPLLISFCHSEYSEDTTNVEITNDSLFILINLTLADKCVQYLLRSSFYSLGLQLFKSKYEIIVTKIFELYHNILVEFEAYDQLIQDDAFEKAFLYRLEKSNPQSIISAAGQCIKDLCLNYQISQRKNDLAKILMLIHHCITETAVEGLIELIPQDMALSFIQQFRALVLKLICHPIQTINILNYFSTLNDRVLDLLLDFPIIEQLISIRNSKVQCKVYATLANLASYHCSHERLQLIVEECYDQYIKSDYQMKVELIHFIYCYLSECSTYEYIKLVDQRFVDTLVEGLKDIYDSVIIEKVLGSLQILFLVDQSKQRFIKAGGLRSLEMLSQNNYIVQMSQQLIYSL